ncbi:hypothetical protein SAMN05428945_4961 [Streptomyces sp. 2224.1]|nr:hypothetical protein BX261_0373 [Streptomyces sp. 2321.6]SDR58184.1 hypothetical protein SAMN05216511_6848 [Streptomyces sp. KS_16]SEB78665.1 hypothetical protein SAMN05428940_0373 [Streptomyces sp. 2133.1]SED46123.1 hypothetical protein SAMN05428945_4961 [Streptomyces sp. 2224.1]SEF14098.1 hypothetical protein SAMN05428954_6900 [Streptomyces sp. 2112.3]SNC60922.1 hypothetical protein SAMN06272741_0374 [Streptomyces sp. 2114.4]
MFSRLLRRRKPHRLVLLGNGSLIHGFSGGFYDGHGYQH